MDELKNNTQEEHEALEPQEGLEAQKDYPFIVEITAASLIDYCDPEQAEQWAADPERLKNVSFLINYMADTAQKIKNDNQGQDLTIGTGLESIPDYKPEFNPESQAFDIDQYKAAIDEMGQKAFLDDVAARYAEIYQSQAEMLELLNTFDSDRLREVIRTAWENAGKAAGKKELELPTVLNKKQMLSVKSKVADAFSLVRFSDTDKGAITIEADGKKYAFSFANFNSLKGTSGISAHKLLCTALSQYTQNNHYGKSQSYRVNIPLKEYARALGYKIDADPEAANQKKEKQRAAEEMKNARKRIKRDMDTLFALRAEWNEVIKGEPRNFGKFQFFDSVSINDGIITLDFGRKLSEEYLSKSLPLTNYPRALLRIDGRKPSAYQIGLAITEHYNIIYNHIGKGNPNLLSVKTLLEKAGLPSIESVRKNRQNWEERIKEPFETALEELYSVGVISDWRYSLGKNEDLANDDAYEITSYEVFSSLYVYYEIKDAADLSEIAAIKKAMIDERAANKKKREKKNIKKG